MSNYSIQQIAEAISRLATAHAEASKAINRLAKSQEDANEIEKRKVTTHSMKTVYLDDDPALAERESGGENS